MSPHAATRAAGLLVLCLFSAHAFTTLAQGTDRGGPNGPKHPDPKKVEHDFLNERVFGGKRIPPGAYDKALDEWRRMPRATPKRSATRRALAGGTSLNGTTWKPIGPMPIKQGSTLVNGRVHAIAISPNNPNVLYQGASGGGVWKSTDAGTTWVPLFDQLVSLGVGQPSAVAIDPSDTDTLYVGTSSAFQFFPVTPDLTKGILKSTDGGGSWIVLGSGFPAGNTGNALIQFNGHDVSAVIVDPADGTILNAAADDGLYRSTDSGQNWGHGTNGLGNSESLVLDASSPSVSRVLFAGITSSGIRRSTDGGQSWTQVLTLATPAVAAAMPVPPAGGSGPFLGKVVVALAPPASSPNPAGVQVVYATIEGSTNDSSGKAAADVALIFESTDQGATWSNRAATGLGGCQCFFTNVIGVDPASPGDGANDVLYWGGTGLFRSTDSGATFSDVSNGQHVDHHAIMQFVRRPSMPSLVYTGNDGGIFRSSDDGATWTGAGAGPATINAGGLQTALIYDLDIRKDNTASTTLASLQDNGTIKTTGSLQWQDNSGGDGFYVSYDGVNLDDAYAITGCDDGVSKTTNNGDSYFDVTGTIPASELGCSILQANTDPSNAGVVYVGGSGSKLFQSTDGGANWRVIGTFGGPLNVNVAPANPNNVAAGVGGKVFLSQNALAATVGPPTGVTFTDITRNLPGGFVTRLRFDPNDPTVLYATLSGFQTGHVFRTTIASSTWTNISPPVDVPFNSLALDGGSSPTGIYAGTDLGVMRSLNGGASWSVLDDIHLPNVPVTEIRINAAAGVMRASTYGRGAFEFAAAAGPVLSYNAQNGLAFGTVCAGTTAGLTLQVFNTGVSDLIVTDVRRIFGSTDFTVAPNPSTPVTISPNSEVDFTIRFTPSITSGTETAQIRIESNDPAAPAFDLFASATVASGAVKVSGATDFGAVCAGATAEETISVCNVGSCDLHVLSATVSCPDFTIEHNPFPATVSHDFCAPLTVRFTPTSDGPKSCTLTITTDDPANPVVTLTLTGTTPAPSIDVPPDQSFLPEVIQSVGSCSTAQAFPISNKGTCPLTITAVSIGGDNAGDFGTSGLPSLPAVLQPGHVLGEGDFDTVFAPTEVDRDRTATLTVTYVSDPVTGATSTVTRNLCGEGVRTGARVLVTASGVPLSTVESIQLQRVTGNRNKKIIDTVDVSKNLPLQTVTPAGPCPPFQYHREYGTVSNPIQLLPGTYQVTATGIVNGKRVKKTVGFQVATCDFDPSVVIALQ